MSKLNFYPPYQGSEKMDPLIIWQNKAKAISAKLWLSWQSTRKVINIFGNILVLVTFQFWWNFCFGEFFHMWNWICSKMKLDLFQCEIGFVPMWNWICFNIKLVLCQCEVWFVPMWNWIYSNVRWDFFKWEIGFVPLWMGFLQIRNGICSNVKLDLFWFEIGFVLMWNLIFC